MAGGFASRLLRDKEYKAGVKLCERAGEEVEEGRNEQANSTSAWDSSAEGRMGETILDSEVSRGHRDALGSLFPQRGNHLM